jgi:hypothetical protein
MPGTEDWGQGQTRPPTLNERSPEAIRYARDRGTDFLPQLESRSLVHPLRPADIASRWVTCDPASSGNPHVQGHPNGEALGRGPPLWIRANTGSLPPIRQGGLPVLGPIEIRVGQFAPQRSLAGAVPPEITPKSVRAGNRNDQNADDRCVRSLRACRERPHGRGAAKQSDNVVPLSVEHGPSPP